MKLKENRPFYFCVIVWVGTWLLAPIVYLIERRIPGLDESSPAIAAIPDLQLLGKLYPVSLGAGFLLFGVFSFTTDFLAKTKMPVWLIKAILSILAFLLVRLGFFIVGAKLEDWLDVFRDYYIVIVFIWSTRLRNKKPLAADMTATA